ncbi:MAG: hypothetical protein ACR2ML_01365 [Solirubrobacteraceae bacterium]
MRAAFAACLGLASCGGPGVAEVESKLTDELSAQLARQSTREQELRESGQLEDEGAGTSTTPKVERVDCPDDVETKSGTTFRCRALGKGRAVVGTLTVVMLDDGKPSWSFTAAQAL